MEPFEQDDQHLLSKAKSRKYKIFDRANNVRKRWCWNICIAVFVFVLVGLLCVVGYLARYVRVLTNDRKNADGQPISETMFQRFNLMQQYAAASYCPLNVNTTGTKITCSVGNCPLVEAADTKTEVEFINVGKTDVTGFVATDHTNRLVVISFRGSSTLQNWITDGIYSKSDTDICPSCQVHDGFWFSWSEARNRVLAALENTASKNAGYQIVVVGHSLGGAIGVLCAAEMRKKGRNVELYTFGAPRVGSKAFSQFVTDQGSNFRVTHYNDIVPRLPPLEFGNKIRRELSFALSKRGPLGGFGYVHISPEYYIRSGTNVTVKVDDIDTYHGLVSFKGNTGQAVPSVDAHRWYFNAISACG